MWFRLLTICIALIPVHAAHASIYKCEENGKTVFRDKPCKAGKGSEFNLGATIEDTDPTGTAGDVSGSFVANRYTISIKDALGILERSKSVLSLFLIPDRYSSAEVQHFQDTGDGSILKNKPAANVATNSTYPYLNMLIQFRKGQPRTRDSIVSAELRYFGVQADDKPLIVKLNADEAQQAIRYISIFEDIGYGDVNLEAEGQTEIASWKISIKAPLYYH